MPVSSEASLSSLCFSVIGSTVCWTALYLALVRSKLANQTPEFYCRIVTVTHAIGAVILSAGCYWQGPDPFHNPGESNTQLQDLTLVVSLGYFWFDLAWCLYHQTEPLIMLVHHLASVIAIGMVLLERTSGGEAVAGILRLEVTNPLLQLRWFLRTAGLNHTIIHTLVELSFIVSFVFMCLDIYTNLTVAQVAGILSLEVTNPLLQLRWFLRTAGLNHTIIHTLVELSFIVSFVFMCLDIYTNLTVAQVAGILSLEVTNPLLQLRWFLRTAGLNHTIIHTLVELSFIVSFVFMCLDIYTNLTVAQVAGILSLEVTNPLLQLRWFLRTAGLNHTIIHTLVELSFIVSFVFMCLDIYTNLTVAQVAGILSLEVTNPLLQLRWFLRTAGFSHTIIHTLVELSFIVSFVFMCLDIYTNLTVAQVAGILSLEVTNPLLQLRWFLRTAGLNHTIIHTLVELSFIVSFVFMCLDIYTNLTVAQVAGILSLEVTNPLLQLRWFLRTAGLNHTIIHTLVELSFIVSFVFMCLDIYTNLTVAQVAGILSLEVTNPLLQLRWFLRTAGLNHTIIHTLVELSFIVSFVFMCLDIYTNLTVAQVAGILSLEVTNPLLQLQWFLRTAGLNHTIIHTLVELSFIVSFVFMCLDIYTNLTVAQVAGILSLEVTNPLLQLRWFLRTAGLNHTIIHTLVELSFVVSFVFMRLGIGSYLTYCVVVSQKPKRGVKLCTFSLYLISLTFIYYIFKFIKKKYTSPKQKSSD